jgi:aminoglycoside phosphotransferase
VELTRLAELRARRALAAAGLGDDAAPLIRVESVTNEVWANGDVVVRVGGDIGSRLRREAALAACVPPEVRYPRILAVGDDGGVEWLVSERVAGVPLVRCWPGLTENERRAAVRDLAAAVRALHETASPDGLPDAPDAPHLLQTGDDPTRPLLAALDRARHLRYVDAGLMAETARFVDTLASALDPFTSATLVHGDLHLQNVLWDGSAVSAVLDLEFARAAPADLDLDVFLRFCALPFLFVPVGREHEARPEHYADVPSWFRETYPALFDGPRLLDRLRLYAVAFDVQDLLANPPNVAPSRLTRHHPHRRLVATMHGDSQIDAFERAVG